MQTTAPSACALAVFSVPPPDDTSLSKATPNLALPCLDKC